MSHRRTTPDQRQQATRSALATLMMIAVISGRAMGQAPFLEFRYEFDTQEPPLVDSTGNHADLGLGQNGVEHRFGEPPLVEDDGFSIGLDAPGVGHRTGSYLTLVDAPHPDSFSVSLWMQPQLTGETQALFARDNVWWPSPCNFYCLYVDSFQSLVWKTGGVETILSDEVIIEDDELYHVVVTHSDTDGPDTGSADRSRIYVNGEMVDEVEQPDEIPSLDALADANDIYRFLWVGTLSSLGGFWGEMDDLQFYSTELSPDQVSEMYANPGTLANFGASSGDFDGDGELTAADIDRLSTAIRAGDASPMFDVDANGSVDDGDRQYWVNQLKGTYFGDSNLDGEFNSTDFVFVFQAGLYEDDVARNAGWETGDWNGDADFDSADFVTAFQQGGYEQGPRVVAAVPEPTSISLATVGLLVTLFRLKVVPPSMSRQ